VLARQTGSWWLRLARQTVSRDWGRVVPGLRRLTAHSRVRRGVRSHGRHDRTLVLR